jgi:hypothetical protein
MKKLTLLLLLLICSIFVKAQLFSRHYDPGSFYTLDNKKINGLISFTKYLDFFHYKDSEKGSVIKYKIEDVKSVVVVETIKPEMIIGLFKKKGSAPKTVIDSFVVKAIEKPNKKLYFAKVVCALSTYKIYHKILPPRGGSPTMNVGVGAGGQAGSSLSYHNTYTWSAGRSYPGGYDTYYEKDGVTFELTKSNYKEILAIAFADVPTSVAMLSSTKYKDVEKVIQSYVTAKTGVPAPSDQ